MESNVNVIEQHDTSVDELLNKTAKQLKEKYNKQRKIKFKLLNKKTPLRRVLSIISDVLCVLIVLIAFVVCFSSLSSAIQGFTPSFMGCTNMVVASKSMENSGYYVGDAIVIRFVDTNTLNVGDKIAFYLYPASYVDFDVEQAENISNVVSETKFSLTFKELFGFRNNEMKQANKAKAELIFHHIKEVYVDENGTRWFKTYGTSNPSEDNWWVKDTMVVGIEDDSIISTVMGGLLSITTRPFGILVVIIPAALIVVTLIAVFLRSMQLAKLELDCVEEKRKITDPICVKYKVGFNMDKKSKIKILAQAAEENRDEYVKLLFKNGYMPDNIKKYYLRKKILLEPTRQKLELNRQCEAKFKEGEKPTKIAKFYLDEKKKIEDREQYIFNRMKNIKKLKNS